RVRFQQVVIDLLFSITSNPSMMLLLICAFLFVLGFFVDVTAMLVMFAAPLSAVGLHLGFDPVHFGVVIVMVALIGAVTPPVGSLLFIGCSIAKIPLKAVLSIIWPFVLTLLLVAVLVSLFPNLVLFLPRLLIR
ncbi:MAG: TRAP transporter large permease subunit, partial [Firmicutes bacterium]|nr:TRAP transporter large permease subunit [Bacillota bacterium]